MRVQYLFNSSGEWIAFRKGKYVFNTEGDWIGWLPWGDNDVVHVSGDYLGTIFANNRLFRIINRGYRGYPGYPGHPGYPGYPGYPGFAGFSPLPPSAEDIDIESVEAE